MTYLHSTGNPQSVWDHYTHSTNLSAQKYPAENTDDPGVPALLEAMDEDQRKYFEFDRDAHGRGIYIFMRPDGS